MLFFSLELILFTLSNWQHRNLTFSKESLKKKRSQFNDCEIYKHIICKILTVNMEFCRICGILNTPITVWSTDDETCCRKCKVGELCQFNRTPCGQVFCEKCGILIKNKGLNKRNTSDSNVCGQCDFLGVPCSTNETCQTSKCKICRCYMCTHDHSFHSFGEHNAQTTRLVNNTEPELSKKTSTVFGQHRDTRPDSFYNIKNIPDSLVEKRILEKWKR